MSKQRVRQGQDFLARRARVAALKPPPTIVERHLAPTWEPHTLDGLQCHCKPDHIVVKDEPLPRRREIFKQFPALKDADVIVVHNIVTPDPSAGLVQ